LILVYPIVESPWKYMLPSFEFFGQMKILDKMNPLALSGALCR
jgi:hypothetical protein